MFFVVVGYQSTFAGSEENSYRPIHSFVRHSTEDVTHPRLFVKKLKKHIIDMLIKDGLMQTGYPKPCQFRGSNDGVHYCIADSSASLDTTEPFLLNNEGYHLEFRIINFLSPMPYEAQVYLVPEQSFEEFQRSDLDDRDEKFQRILIVGAIPTIAIHKSVDRAILEAGTNAHKR